MLGYLSLIAYHGARECVGGEGGRGRRRGADFLYKRAAPPLLQIVHNPRAFSSPFQKGIRRLGNYSFTGRSTTTRACSLSGGKFDAVTVSFSSATTSLSPISWVNLSSGARSCSKESWAVA